MTDLFGSGFVPNLARPGSHVTGFTLFEFSVGSKWLEASLPVLQQCALPDGRPGREVQAGSGASAVPRWGADRRREDRRDCLCPARLPGRLAREAGSRGPRGRSSGQERAAGGKPKGLGEPLERRKVELRRLLADTEAGLVFNEWIDGEEFDGADRVRARAVARP